MQPFPRAVDWSDRPLARLIALSWPTALSMLSYSLMTLADTIYVGRLGAPALAGVGLGGTAAFALLCFPFGLLRGAKALVAQAVGAGRRERARAYERAALQLAIVTGVAMIVIGQIVAELLAHATASAAAGQAARAYLHWRNLAAPMTLAFGALREVRHGEGDARSPMIASLWANAANLVLAPLFIFALHLGVAGAGIACALAQSLEALVLFARTRRPGPRPSVPRRHHRELLRMGLPTGVQLALEVGSFALLTLMIASLSEVQMAAHQIVLQVCQLSFLPAWAVSEAASVLAGQAMGARRPDLVLRVARLGLLTAGAYTAACSLVFAGLAPLVVAGFASTAALAQVARRLLRVAALFQVSDGANIVLRAVLRGAGDARFAAVVGVVTAWLMTPPLAWLLGRHLGLGAAGGWLGLAGESTLGALWLWRRLRGGRWRSAAYVPVEDEAAVIERVRAA